MLHSRQSGRTASPRIASKQRLASSRFISTMNSSLQQKKSSYRKRFSRGSVKRRLLEVFESCCRFVQRQAVRPEIEERY